MSDILYVSNDSRRKAWTEKPVPVPLKQTGWEELAHAIILQAVEDYRKALRNLKRWPQHPESWRIKRDCERFFHSRWFAMLTEADPDVILDGIRKEEAV